MGFLKREIRENQLQALFNTKLDHFYSLNIPSLQNLTVFISEYLLLLEFCDEYSLFQQPKFTKVQQYFREKIDNFFSGFKSGFLYKIKKIEEFLIKYKLSFVEIKKNDPQIQDSQNLLGGLINNINLIIPRISQLDKDLELLIKCLGLIKDKLSLTFDINQGLLIESLSNLKFRFITVYYNYTDGLTGSDYFLRQSPKIEITDEFIILYNKNQLNSFKERVDNFKHVSNQFVYNGFTLEYKPFRLTWGDKDISPLYDTQELTQRLEFKLELLYKTLNNYIKLNEILSNSYVSHLTGIQNFKDIIQNGFLASQAFLVEKGFTPAPRSIGGVEKTLMDISFSFGLEMQYGELGFIFPATSLISDHVFYLRESSQYSPFPELHLYDENFDERRNKVGSFIDLSKAVLLIPKVNKIPQSIEEKEALNSVFLDMIVMWQTVKLLKSNLSKEIALNQYSSIGVGIIEYITYAHRYFDWQLTIEELREMIEGDKSFILGKLNQKLREYKSRPELEGLNIFVVAEQLTSHSYTSEDIKENMDYYSTYDAESYWRNYLYQLSQDSNSWFYGKDVEQWIKEHIIFYDRRMYLTIEKFMRKYSFGIGYLYSRYYYLFLRYIRILFRQHKAVLQKQPKGRIVPTHQIARPVQRNKDIVLFKFVLE